MVINRAQPKPGSFPRLRPDPYPSSIAPLVLPGPRHRHLPRPSTTVPSLPKELIARIVHPLRGQDEADEELARQTLRSCCLVATSFLQPAREALYRRVGVRPGFKNGWEGGSESWILLLETLLEHPHLAALVRAIGIKVYYPSCLGILGLEGGPSDSKLARALQTCRNVVEVNLKLAESPECQATLDAIATSAPLLHSLSIVIFGEPTDKVEREYLRVLHSQPRLKSLVASAGVPTTWNPNERLAAELEHLDISGLDVAFSHLHNTLFDTFSASSHSSLRSLTLPYFPPGEHPPTLIRFTQLTSLTLDVLPTDPATFFDQLNHLPLRDLSISGGAEPSDVPPLSSLLAALPPTLRSLHYYAVGLLVPANIISFLDSGNCPLLESLELFLDGGFPPFLFYREKLALEAACRRRGLVLEGEDRDKEEELNDEGIDEGESDTEELRAEKGMRPLESYWGLLKSGGT